MIDFGNYTCIPSEGLFNDFISNLNLVFYESFPLISNPTKRPKHKPWISTSLLKCIKKKQSLFKKCVRDRTCSSKAEYKEYKKYVQKLIRAAEKDYFLQKFSLNKNDIKQTWNTINSLLDKSTSHPMITLKDKQANIIETPADVASAFNSFFSDITSQLKTIPLPPKRLDLPSQPSNPHSCFINPTTVQETYLLLNRLKNSSPGGYDIIPPFLLKKISHVISDPLTIFINFFLSQGIFPQSLKHAKACPDTAYQTTDQSPCYPPSQRYLKR
jgi:hypothetical protein